MWNVHRMFITYIHRTQESRNTKNTYDCLVQVRNFLLPLSLKVLRHKERDTHSFYSGFSICPTSQHVWHPPQGHWPGFGEQAKVNRLLPRQDSTQQTDFFNSPKILRALLVHDVIHIPLSGIFILTSMNDTSAPRVREHLRSCCT